MLKFRLFILWLCLMNVVQMRAQQILISKPIEISNHTPKFKLIGKNNNGIWVRNYGKNEERIDLYNDKLNLYLSKTLVIRRNNFLTITYALNNSGATFFYTDFHKKNFYLCSSSINDRLDNGIERVIDTVSYESSAVDMKLSFEYSTNKERLHFFIPIYQGNMLYGMRVIALNSNGKVNFKSNIVLARTDADTYAEDALVDNDGNTFLIIKHLQKKAKPIYEIKKIDISGKVKDSCFINFQKDIFNDLSFQLDEKNHLINCISFLSNGSEVRPGAKSMLNYSVNTLSMTEAHSVEFEFNDSFISDVTNGMVKENGSLYTYKIKKIIPYIDGGSICMAESFYKEDNEVRDAIDMSMPSIGGMGYSPATRITNIYHYNDIILFYFNADGSLSKYEIIRKKQLTENDNGAFSSFAIFNLGSKLKLIYVDDIIVSADLIEQTIVPTVATNKKTLLNQDEKNLLLIPKMALQTQLNELILPSYRNNDFRLIKINY